MGSPQNGEFHSANSLSSPHPPLLPQREPCLLLGFEVIHLVAVPGCTKHCSTRIKQITIVQGSVKKALVVVPGLVQKLIKAFSSATSLSIKTHSSVDGSGGLCSQRRSLPLLVTSLSLVVLSTCSPHLGSHSKAAVAVQLQSLLHGTV